MKTIYTVISDNGDGSASILWVLDEKVLDKMEELASDGDERYASGDGLQVNTLRFPEDFNLSDWIAMNRIKIKTMEDME